jgi:hypothetical protein
MMLRKVLVFSLLVCGAGVVTAQKAKKNKNFTPEINYWDPGSPMPDMRLVVLDIKDTTKKVNGLPGVDKIVTNKDVDNKANLILMMFNPSCSHCEEQTELLEKNIATFNKSKLVLMAAPTMITYLPDFLKSYNLDQYPSIIIGVDSGGFINKAFSYHMLPQINIYDADRKLIKSFTGGTSMDTLKHYIQ